MAEQDTGANQEKRRVRSPYLFPAYGIDTALQIAELVESDGGRITKRGYPSDCDVVLGEEQHLPIENTHGKAIRDSSQERTRLADNRARKGDSQTHA